MFLKKNDRSRMQEEADLTCCRHIKPRDECSHIFTKDTDVLLLAL